MSTVRPAALTDGDIVTELVRETIKAVYPRYYPAGAVDFFLAYHKSEKILDDIGAGKVYVLERDGVIVGSTVTVGSGEDDISRLFVKPSEQGRGYGSRLLDFAEKNVFEYGSRIQVSASFPAKSMYVKRGYTEKKYCKILTDNGDFLCYDVMEKILSIILKRIDFMIKNFIEYRHSLF